MKIVIIGGGVIGLSLAWELAGRGQEVVLLERGRCGRKASWAGAGILLPENLATSTHPIQQLAAISNTTHKLWHTKLKSQTGIDNGYRESGGLYVAPSRGEMAALVGSIGDWEERKFNVQPLSQSDLRDRFPNVQVTSPQPSLAAVFLPDESQICNPWHTDALLAACKLSGVQVVESVCGLQFERVGDTLTSMVATIAGAETSESFAADVVCFACGAWTENVVDDVGSVCDIKTALPMTPVKGQMVLYKLDLPLDMPILNHGIRYVVPRSDGHVVVGATVEEVGFNESTQESDLAELSELAQSLVPELTPERIVKTWAGLRPGTYDGFPYMGAMPGFSNVLVSTGHFKTGLQLSSGSANVMADLIEGKETEIDLSRFAPSRVLK